MFKISKENIIYTRTYINPENDVAEKVTLIPTGINSGDPELINVKDKEQGITYNIDKTVLDTEYQKETFSLQDNFSDVKKEINKENETSGYNNVINNITKSPTKNNTDNIKLKDTAGQDLDSSEQMSSEEVNKYFLIYKKLLNENYDIFEIAKANSKVNEKKKPEHQLYTAMKEVASEVINNYRNEKKKEIQSQIGDIPISIKHNAIYNKVYKVYSDIKSKYSHYDRDTIVRSILKRMSDREEVDSTIYNVEEFNKYIKQMFFVFLENMYIKNRSNGTASKDALVLRIVDKIKNGDGKYSEEGIKFDLNEFNNFINKKYDDLSESMLKLSEGQQSSDEENSDRNKVYKLIRDRAIKENPELEPLKNKITINGFESELDSEYNSYGLYLRKVIQIIKSVDPKLTVYGLIDCFANYIYGNLETKKAESLAILPILKIAVGIELINKRIL